MKILELRFKNLNSLYGEWLIDFTDSEYTGNGIFALTGPTGAGKSTLLDAVCLALYGATPRLGKITKSSNQIMSRRTGECFAEVLFEVRSGRYRCHFSQHRARKKADGDLQQPRHEIAEAGGGEDTIIESQLRRVAVVIEKKTGMDFERFTRSILLAQGGFDTFLKADAEQKSRILEQITGTEIYTEISRRVHERQRDERERLHILRAAILEIAVLDPAQEKEIRQELDSQQKQEKECGARVIETGKAITWLTGIAGLQKEISSLADETAKLKAETEDFEPKRNQLTRAVKAAALDGKYATLAAVRKQQAADQASLKAEEEKLPGLENSCRQQATVFKNAAQQTAKTREELKQAAPLIQKIRILDQKLADQKIDVSASEKSCREDGCAIEAVKERKIREQGKRSKAGKNLERVAGYLKEHAQDEWLTGGLAGVEEQLNSLIFRQKEIFGQEEAEKGAKKVLARAGKKLESSIQQRKTRQQELEKAEKKLQQGRDTLNGLLGDRLLREYRTEKETLLREMAFFSKIAELEDHRSSLEDGKPCPLCGSGEHPFARGNVPVPDTTEQKIAALTRRIQKAEDQESVNTKLEGVVHTAREHLSKSEKIEVMASGDKQAAEKSLFDLQDSLDKSRSAFGDLQQAAAVRLEPLGIELCDADVFSLLASLQKRQKKWQEQVKQKDEIEKKIAVLDGEVQRLDAVIETREKALAEKQAALDSLQKEYDQGLLKRRQVYGDKKTDVEEHRLNKAISTAERAEQRARVLHDELKQQLISAQANVDSLKKRLSSRDVELQKLEAEFAVSLQPAGFTDEQQFLLARLPPEERDALLAAAKKLDNRKTDLAARQQDRENRLAVETARAVTDKTLEDLEPQFKELEKGLHQLRESRAGLQHRLKENSAARERVKEKQHAVEAQNREYTRWEKLHGLIGSADGKKYRNFAQGITFELMVSHANRQLSKMTDRYLLIRDRSQPLELNVIDNYQAGEIRSTRNLSGGESFIVSLSLALGLSRMASRKVRVDSLFLDEGFGTLDDEALETALETLAGLQQDGKLIGIISHVSALKERIGTQITISPMSGGESTVTGPGCTLL